MSISHPQVHVNSRKALHLVELPLLDASLNLDTIRYEQKTKLLILSGNQLAWQSAIFYPFISCFGRIVTPSIKWELAIRDAIDWRIEYNSTSKREGENTIAAITYDGSCIAILTHEEITISVFVARLSIDLTWASDIDFTRASRSLGFRQAWMKTTKSATLKRS